MTETTARGGEWRIAETGKRCVGCRVPFAFEQSFFSQLEVDSTDDVITLNRKDWCESCWTESEAPSIFWKTRRPAADGSESHVDLAALNQLFLGLIEDTRPEIETLRYVVALILQRKRLLKAVRTAGTARGDLVVKDPRDLEKRLRLPSPDLSEESLENLKEQLGNILG
ncbi:MAG: hypothetical protein CMJ85_12180 [Planctomycetes bacterium]|jgi:hypothetical protein|nr:hypothetical protein [Planctomycetota bacterium]MDP6423536.1 hypothetical protein [Planctomycetota bacterium]